MGVLGLFWGFPAFAALLSVGVAHTEPGGPGVGVPVVLDAAAGEEISAVEFDLAYDPEALVLRELNVGAAALQAGKSLSFTEFAPGVLRVVVAGLNQSVIPNGFVALAVFQAHDYTSGFLPISLGYASLSSPYGEPVPAAVAGGGVHVRGEPAPTAEGEGKSEGEYEEILDGTTTDDAAPSGSGPSVDGDGRVSYGGAGTSAVSTETSLTGRSAAKDAPGLGWNGRRMPGPVIAFPQSQPGPPRDARGAASIRSPVPGRAAPLPNRGNTAAPQPSRVRGPSGGDYQSSFTEASAREGKIRQHALLREAGAAAGFPEPKRPGGSNAGALMLEPAAPQPPMRGHAPFVWGGLTGTILCGLVFWVRARFLGGPRRKSRVRLRD